MKQFGFPKEYRGDKSWSNRPMRIVNGKFFWGEDGGWWWSENGDEFMEKEAMNNLADTCDTSVFIETKGGGWRAIKTAPRDGTVIDVWLTISASPLSMGMADSFGVPDAWFKDGKWVHTYRGKPTELNRNYITHWRPRATVS